MKIFNTNSHYVILLRHKHPSTSPNQSFGMSQKLYNCTVRELMVKSLNFRSNSTAEIELINYFNFQTKRYYSRSIKLDIPVWSR